ncbi:Eco29kI family restriction endonuclease [Gleimia europaea]|uniref:Eco29kI restriction endonuclease n=1 Tax=Gleimia europaea ACS-120-V-Col10b TaxID=883069 RepID=A0A9W5RFK8_9ACTO|nr:Eco29kI family restriction endonuclease [Gleimia europaea]EPD31497.1 hypothetical protein HMPREF9238_01273 [Gleimia europaea ACS-120-V-Col10b]
MVDYFDPLSYENLGASIARALEERPIMSLAHIEPFDGAGIYALYYTGSHVAYEPLSRQNSLVAGTWAIYIGKAEAENARKGDPDQAHLAVGPKLFNRIRGHKRSIEAATNLDVRDFQVRALTIAPTWIPLAEVVAIRLHNPVWNVIVDGLGNHDPGSGRYAGMRPRWDTIHPGRKWADKLQARTESASDIEQEAIEYLRSRSLKP